MPGSDPFGDDEFDNLDPTVFDAIDKAVEKFSASQAPRVIAQTQSHNQSAGPSKHHTIAQPRSNGINGNGNGSGRPQAYGPGGMPPAPFGRNKNGRPRAPAPLNTTPGVTGTGFGWEHGGKRSMDANLSRNLQAIEERQTYWYGSSQGGNPQGLAQAQEYGRTGGQGHSRATSIPAVAPVDDEDQVLDTHNAPESIPPSMPTRSISRTVRGVSEEAKAARRAAMMNSAGPSTSTPIHAPAPRPAAMTNRSFSRSASTGSHILSRPQPMAGPSRLSPIPDQPSSQASSQNSSGALLRRTHLELEEYKKREATMLARLAELEARHPVPPATQNQRSFLPDEPEMALPSGTQAAWSAHLPLDVDLDDKEAVARKLRELQTEVWTRKGAETNVRKQMKDRDNAHKQEKEQLEAAQARLKAEMAQQVKDQQARLDTVRSEAVFANHHAQTTGSRSRAGHVQSSQRPQRIGLQTPMPGSPSRRGGQDEGRPLMSSSKGKVPAPPPPFQPAFRGFTNAFDPPPTTRKTPSRQTDRSRGPAPSPIEGGTRIPSQRVKQEPDEDDDMQGLGEMGDGIEGYETHAPVASPSRTPRKRASQARSNHFDDGDHHENGVGSQGADHVLGDVSVDAEVDEVEDQLQVLKRDDRSAFMYTLVNHNRPTSLHIHVDRRSAHQTALRRILAYQPPPEDGVKPKGKDKEGEQAGTNVAYSHDPIVWTETASSLLATLGDAELLPDKVIARAARHIDSLVEWMLRRLIASRAVTEHDLCATLDLFSLMTALARLFPLFASEIVENSTHSRPGGSWPMLSIELYTSEPIRRQVRRIYRKIDKALAAASASLAGTADSEQGERGVNGQASGPVAAAATAGVQRRRPIPVLPKEVHEMLMATGGLELGSAASPNIRLGAGPGNSGVSEEEEEEWSEEADWCTRELGCAVASLGEVLCLYARGDEMGEAVASIIFCLSEQRQHPTVVRRACEMFRAAATFSSHFRNLTVDRPDSQSLIDRLSNYLAAKHRKGDPEELLSASLAIIRGLAMMAVADPAAIVLISEKSRVVPSLITILDHEVRKVWGANIAGDSAVNAALLIYPTLMLLHMFVLPPPFNGSYQSFAQAYNQPQYPSKTITITPDQAPEGARGIARPLTITRPADEVKADREAFIAAQEPILSALPDAEIARPRVAGGASQSISIALNEGTGIPAALRLEHKLAEWTRYPEMRHVRDLFIAALSAAAYDEVLEELLVPGLDDEAEQARMKRRGVGRREIMDNLRFSQLLAANILEALYAGPEVDQLYDLYNVEQPEGDSQLPEDEALAIDMHNDHENDDEDEALGPDHIDLDIDMDIDDVAAPNGAGERDATPGSSKRPRSSKGHGGASVSTPSEASRSKSNGHVNGNGSGANSSRPQAKSPLRPARMSPGRGQVARTKSQPKAQDVVHVISDDSDDGL